MCTILAKLADKHRLAGDRFTADRLAFAKEQIRSISISPREAGAESGWQSIAEEPTDKAPFDGMPVLITRAGIVGEAVYESEEGHQGWFWAGSHWTDAHDGSAGYPTYWQPLPAPPAMPTRAAADAGDGARKAPASCPNCFDETDCSNVDICSAVAEVYAAPSMLPVPPGLAEGFVWPVDKDELPAPPSPSNPEDEAVEAALNTWFSEDKGKGIYSEHWHEYMQSAITAYHLARFGGDPGEKIELARAEIVRFGNQAATLSSMVATQSARIAALEAQLSALNVGGVPARAALQPRSET